MIRVAGYELRVTSCGLQVAGYGSFDLGHGIVNFDRMTFGLLDT